MVLDGSAEELNSLPPFLPAVSGKPLSCPLLPSPFCKREAKLSYLTEALSGAYTPKPLRAAASTAGRAA